MVQGYVAPGLEEVYEVFKRNFEERDELGAALVVYRQGEPLIDLWGGFRDGKEKLPWEKDTMVMVFSGTKGINALTMALAHSRGLLEYDKPIAHYWPEFAQQGKEKITVRQLFDNQAGLAVIDTTLTPELLADPDQLAKVLAAQKPAWEPGERHGYHAVSLGLYQTELMRRIDPHHRGLSQFFRDEIAVPLGLDFYIGLSDNELAARRARLEYLSLSDEVEAVASLPTEFNVKMLWPWSLPHQTLHNPPIKSLTDFNDPPYLQLEIPSVNGIGTARAMAKLYSVFATGGQELGIKQATIQALEDYPLHGTGGTQDMVLKIETCFSLGLWKPCDSLWFGTDTRAYGTPGVGGALGFADPARQVGYAYTTNRLGLRFWNDPREVSLREALYRCLA